MATIYRHIRLDRGEVFYVGIGKEEKRAYVDYGRNQYWNNITKQTEYRVEILFNDLPWEEACEKEREFISLYGRKDLGLGTLVNLTDGGDSSIGAKFSDEVNSKKGTPNNRHFGGRKHTEESKQKMSLTRTGQKKRPHSEESKKNISASKVGKPAHNRQQISFRGVLYNSLTEAATQTGYSVYFLKKKGYNTI